MDLIFGSEIKSIINEFTVVFWKVKELKKQRNQFYGIQMTSKNNEFSVLEAKTAQKTITGIFWNTKDFKNNEFIFFWKLNKFK